MALLAAPAGTENPGGVRERALNAVQPNLAPASLLPAENTGRPLPQPTGFLGLFTLALYQRCPE